MKIEKSVYKEILSSINDAPPEMGGILGKKEDVVLTFEIDFGQTTNEVCNYSPNVDRLNLIISKWQEEGIEFAGIFHTHFFSVSTLSEGDVYYVDKIMRNMPSTINELFFPVIALPEKNFVSYKALLNEEQLSIKKQDIEIVGGMHCYERKNKN